MIIRENNKPLKDYLHFDSPTQEQTDALVKLEEFVKPENEADFFVLSGAAGTGKTSLISALILYLNHKGTPYRIAAPTGRAARILGRKARTVSSTIHAMIYIPKPDSKTGKVVYKLKQASNKTPGIFIIDEASMVSTLKPESSGLFEAEQGLIFDLVSFIKKANIKNKIIFLGDRYQLPPIGEQQSFALNAQYLKDTFNMIGYSFTLSEVKRQSDGSYILQNATEIRDAMDQGLTSWPIAGNAKGSIYRAADDYVQNLRNEGPEDAVAIGVSHKANKFFNDLVRDRIFGRAKQLLQTGDLLMVTQNYSREGVDLYNGDHVLLLKVDWNVQEEVAGLHFVPVQIKLLFSEKEVLVEDYAVVESLLMPGGRIDYKAENELRNQRYIKNRIFRESQMPGDDRYVGALRLMYGHAITCNKAQGGEWKKVYINTLGIPSLKWQYTAVTRGIEEIEKF